MNSEEESKCQKDGTFASDCSACFLFAKKACGIQLIPWFIDVLRILTTGVIFMIQM